MACLVLCDSGDEGGFLGKIDNYYPFVGRFRVGTIILDVFAYAGFYPGAFIIDFLGG